MIRLLVVDDSAFARCAILKLVSACPEIEIVGFAQDGIQALELVRELKPDVITLDVEMPRMSGLEALEAIMKEAPTPVIMASSLTCKGRENTLRALETGAVDFFLKVSPAKPAGSFGSRNDLITKIILAADINRDDLKRRPGKQESQLVLRCPPPSRNSSLRIKAAV